MDKKQLKKEFNNQPTLKDKRLFALKYVENENHKEMLKYEKLSHFSIHCLFYMFLGEKYTQKRTYVAKQKKQRSF